MPPIRESFDALFPGHGQQLDGGHLPVAGGGVMPEDDMPRLLAADGVAAVHHFLEHIAIPHLGGDRGDAVLLTEAGKSPGWT